METDFPDTVGPDAHPAVGTKKCLYLSGNYQRIKFVVVHDPS